MKRKPSYTPQARRRQNNRKYRWLMALLLIGAGILCVTSFTDRSDSGIKAAHTPIQAENITMVSPAQLMEVAGNEQLASDIVEYDGMTISFNNELHIPNWVAWELTPEEASAQGNWKRRFRTDPDVVGCPNTSDYTNSGYDRGHMAPAADLKLTEKMYNESCYLTNIVPQSKELNTGAWNSLEQKCRARVTQTADSAIIIICGPVPNEEAIETIGASRVHVPRQFFKVIYAPFAPEPYAIGFIMPNRKVTGGIGSCAMTVDSVESVTGYDFFSALPDSIENIIESKINFDKWSRLK